MKFVNLSRNRNLCRFIEKIEIEYLFRIFIYIFKEYKSGNGIFRYISFFIIRDLDFFEHFQVLTSKKKKKKRKGYLFHFFYVATSLSFLSFLFFFFPSILAPPFYPIFSRWTTRVPIPTAFSIHPSWVSGVTPWKSWSAGIRLENLAPSNGNPVGTVLSRADRKSALNKCRNQFRSLLLTRYSQISAKNIFAKITSYFPLSYESKNQCLKINLNTFCFDDSCANGYVENFFFLSCCLIVEHRNHRSEAPVIPWNNSSSRNR